MKAAEEKPIEVAAGLVFRDGKLLITRRPAAGHLGGLWEFPGGKREAGETFPQCLRRELQEELGIRVEVGELIEDLVHHYPERTVRLKFFHCRWLRHEPRAILCDALVWITQGQLTDYAFPEADLRILEKLRQRPELWAEAAPPKGNRAAEKENKGE
jgi:mutator protein MutT